MCRVHVCEQTPARSILGPLLISGEDRLLFSSRATLRYCQVMSRALGPSPLSQLPCQNTGRVGRSRYPFSLCIQCISWRQMYTFFSSAITERVKCFYSFHPHKALWNGYYCDHAHFYRWENCGTEERKWPVHVTQLISGRAGTWTQAV